MTQAEIRKQYKALQQEPRQIRAQTEAINGRAKALQALCDHPKSYRYSAMGEMGTTCPDCGWST